MDEAFLKLLKEATTGTTKGEKGKSQLHKLNLEENNVAKVGQKILVKSLQSYLILSCYLSHVKLRRFCLLHRCFACLDEIFIHCRQQLLYRKIRVNSASFAGHQ